MNFLIEHYLKFEILADLVNKAIIIVYVRGTSEAANVGTIVGPPAFKSLRTALKDPLKLGVQGVEWAGLLSTYKLGGDPKGIDDM